MDNIELSPENKALAGAIDMALRGYRVFPAEAKDQPRFKWKEGATVDLDTIRSWAPFRYYGVAFGADQFALDLDCKGGKNGVNDLTMLEIQNGEIPATLIMRTTSGGFHVYLKGLASNSVGKLADGIDVRAEGGYCIGPGSEGYEIHEDNSVAVAPAWLLPLIAPRSDVVEAPKNVTLDDPGNLARARNSLANNPVAVQGHGGNNRTYQTIAALKDLGVSQDLVPEVIADWNSRCVPPWPSEELAVIIRNVFTYGQNEPGAYATAAPEVTFAEAVKSLPVDFNAPGLTPPDPLPIEVDQSGRFILRRPPDFKNRPIPKWLIDGLIMEKRTHVLYGKSESLKTFFALDLLASIACAVPAFGRYKVYDPGDVVFFCDEDPDDLMTVRWVAWCKKHGIDPAAETRPGQFIVVDRCPLIADPQDVTGAIQAIKKHNVKPRLIVVDTLAKAMTGLNQDSAKDTGLLYAAMTEMRRHFDCATLLTHHPKKADAGEMRGSSAQSNDADIIWQAQRNGQTFDVTWTCRKMKAATKPNEPLYFKGELFATGATNQAGQQVTAPVFNATDTKPISSEVIGLADWANSQLRDRVVQFLIQNNYDQHETRGRCIRAEDLAQALCPAPRDGRTFDWDENNEYQALLKKLKDGARHPGIRKRGGKNGNRSGGFLFDLAKSYPLPGGKQNYTFFAYTASGTVLAHDPKDDETKLRVMIAAE